MPDTRFNEGLLERTKEKSVLRVALVYLSGVKNKTICIQATKMDKNKYSDEKNSPNVVKTIYFVDVSFT